MMDCNILVREFKLSFHKDGLGFNLPIKLDTPLNKETKQMTILFFLLLYVYLL